MVVLVKGGTECNSGFDPGEELGVYSFYRNTDAGVQHEWSNTSITAVSGPFWVECNGNTATIHANFTNSGGLTAD